MNLEENKTLISFVREHPELWRDCFKDFCDVNPFLWECLGREIRAQLSGIGLIETSLIRSVFCILL